MNADASMPPPDAAVRRRAGGGAFLAGFGVAGLVLGVVLVLVGSRSPAQRVKAEWVRCVPSGVVDPAGAEPFLLTLRVIHGDPRRPDPVDWVYFKNEGKQIVAWAGGSWHPVSDTFNLQMLRRGDTQEISVLVPPRTDRCQIGVLGAWTPWKWRLANRVRPLVDRLPGRLRTWIWATPKGGLVWQEIQIDVTRSGP